MSDSNFAKLSWFERRKRDGVWTPAPRPEGSSPLSHDNAAWWRGVKRSEDDVEKERDRVCRKVSGVVCKDDLLRYCMNGCTCKSFMLMPFEKCPMYDRAAPL